ncbi:hypothetical protein [Microbacterium nymphoidis]|uniref:hypothetical protein n=1 Tax=Microbacterium nymphoidis TaxID=2898586 RepID=UPI001E6446F2|nr:hypothetical protein [Microbacterium nymphoidis]MCD2499348.1 hypothetical protein [Microbacterium nymphoidis]
MAGEQNTGGTPPDSGGFDGFAPMPLGQRSSEELGLGPSAARTWPNGRPEYGGLPPYGTPYVPPVYPPAPTAGAPAGPPSAPAGIPYTGIPYTGTPYAGTPYTGTPYAGTPYTGSPYAGTPYAGTPHASASHAGAPHAGAPYAGAQHPASSYPVPAPDSTSLPAPAPPLAVPPGYAAAPRANGLPSWGWAVLVLIALAIIVVVGGAAARILTAAPETGPATPVAGASNPGAPTAGAPAPEGTVTLDMSANLPAGTVLAMAESADWAPYDTTDPEHLLGPAAPAGDDAWRSPCYFALHSNEGAFGDDDRDGSEYWGELAQKYAAPGTTASPIAPLLVPGPDGTLYEFSGYSEVSTGDYEKASVSYARVDVAGDRTYEIAVRCDGTEVPQEVLHAVASQFQLK